MRDRRDDGSAGDVNYAAVGFTYSAYRQPDPRIALLIREQLGPAASVLNSRDAARHPRPGCDPDV